MSDDLKERTKHKIADRHPNWSTMQKLLDRIEELERERVLSLREKRDYAYEAKEAERQRDEALAALRWYAEEERYDLCVESPSERGGYTSQILMDRGQRARAALNATAPAEEHADDSDGLIAAGYRHGGSEGAEYVRKYVLGDTAPSEGVASHEAENVRDNAACVSRDQGTADTVRVPVEAKRLSLLASRASELLLRYSDHLSNEGEDFDEIVDVATGLQGSSDTSAPRAGREDACAQARAEERERCARVAEAQFDADREDIRVVTKGRVIAAAIRASRDGGE